MDELQLIEILGYYKSILFDLAEGKNPDRHLTDLNNSISILDDKIDSYEQLEKKPADNLRKLKKELIETRKFLISRI